MTKQIVNKINQLLQENNISFDAVYLGKTKRDKWDCYAWKTHFGSLAKTGSFDYFTGLACVEKLEDARKQQLMREYGNGITLKDEARKSVLWRNFEYWIKKTEVVKPSLPSATDCLHSLILDSSACLVSFEDWCEQCGYDNDSRKALETYLLCQTNSKKIRSILGNEVFATATVLLQDY